MELFKSKLIISYGNFLSKQIADDEQRIIIDLLEKDEKAKLLDLGCLYGNRTYEFMEKISPAKTFGLDILSFALKKAKQLLGKPKARQTDVEVRMDSELIVKQMKAIYKIEDAKLQPLFVEIWNLRLDFKSVIFKHVPREMNKTADRMVNRALDEHKK